MNQQEIAFKRSVARNIIKVMGAGFVNGFELARMSYVREDFINFLYRNSKQIPASMDPESPLFRLLQNSGDLWDGYLLSMGTYCVASILTLNRLRRSIKAALAFGVSAAIVIAAETGQIPPTPDDIPAGLVGGALFLGTHLVGSRIAARLPIQNTP